MYEAFVLIDLYRFNFALQCKFDVFLVFIKNFAVRHALSMCSFQMRSPEIINPKSN